MIFIFVAILKEVAVTESIVTYIVENESFVGGVNCDKSTFLAL